MDAMTMAKKKVLGDLIREMQKKMLAADTGVEDESAPEVEIDSEGDEASDDGCEVCDEPPAKSGMTISLAAIKKASKPVSKSASGLPSALEMALMGKEKNKFKKA